jgi:acyl transferase domain-containing protein
MFTGQGAQYVNMGLGLYHSERKFRECVDRCSEILMPLIGLDLRDILYPKEADLEEASEALNQTYITQPALFTVEYALAQLWMSWGLHPTAMIGHSIGEYVAACLAEVFSPDDALWLVAARGQVMQAALEGSMLSLSLSEDEVQPLLNAKVSLAAINTPSHCVISGDNEAIRDMAAFLTERKISHQYLKTNRAFHSAMMDSARDSFRKQVEHIRARTPRIPFISDVTGTWITPEQATDPNYWAIHIRETVRFGYGIREILKKPNQILLEIGPGQTLSGFLHQHPDRADHQVAISSLRHPFNQQPDEAFLLNSLGQLWAAGARMDWGGYHAGEGRRRVPLPTYPFQRQSYWIDSTHVDLPSPVESLREPTPPQPVISPGPLPSPTIEGNNGPSNQLRQGFGPLKERHSAIRSALYRASSYTAPRTPAEAVIAWIWQQVLCADKVGVHENFYELGGNSLLAAQVIGQLNRTLMLDLPPIAVVESPTVAELAERIETVYSLKQVRIASGHE